MPSSGHQTLSGLLIVTPATLTGLTFTPAPGALERVLVGPQSEEGRLPKLVVGGPLGVRDLPDELGADPHSIVHAWRRVERRAVDAEPFELRRQRREALTRESGSDLADEDEGPAAVEAHEQRAEMLPAAGRRRIAADHELRLLAHLHLEPCARARVRLVRRAFVLRDDPFPTLPLRLAVRRLTIADETAREENRIRVAADQTFERGAPLGERPVEKRAPVELEQIEDRVARARGPRGATAL